MTYFADLSAYAYVAPSVAGVRNVGWLDGNHAFPTGAHPPQRLDAIWAYCGIIVFPTRGLHDCPFCSSPSRTFARHHERLLLGSGEIRVFGPKGVAFAAPNLIYHYMLEHSYLPPDEFLKAIEEGPAPGSYEYGERLRGLNVEWRQNAPVSAEPRAFRFVRGAIGAAAEEVHDPRGTMSWPSSRTVNSFARLRALGLEPTWRGLLIGWSGLEQIGPWVDAEDVERLAVERIVRAQDEQLGADLAFLAAAAKEDPREVRDCLQRVAEQEGSDEARELRKWRAVLLAELLDRLPTDDLETYLSLAGFWSAFGFPNDVPESLFREGAPNGSESQAADGRAAAVALHESWLASELRRLRADSLARTQDA